MIEVCNESCENMILLNNIGLLFNLANANGECFIICSLYATIQVSLGCKLSKYIKYTKTK